MFEPEMVGLGEKHHCSGGKVSLVAWNVTTRAYKLGKSDACSKAAAHRYAHKYDVHKRPNLSHCHQSSRRAHPRLLTSNVTENAQGALSRWRQPTLTHITGVIKGLHTGNFIAFVQEAASLMCSNTLG